MDGAVHFEGTYTDRRPSASVWGHFPYEAIKQGEVAGVIHEFDFETLPITVPTTEGNFGPYNAFSDTGGTITEDTTELGGAWALGSDNDNEGASIRQGGACFQLALTKKRFCFEARILTSTITDTKHNIFLGLMENTPLTAIVPITALGALADKNLVGFKRPESARSTAGTGGAIMNTVYKADGVTAVTIQNDAVTLVAGTYTKLGMKFEPREDRAGAGTLSFYQDGTRLTGYKVLPSTAGDDFPNDVLLAFVFAVVNATGTTPGTSSIDWVRVGQEL